MRLEITAISSICLDAEVFSQRIISIDKQICGFAWGRKGGRNKLVTSNRDPGVMASQLNTHAFNISPVENRRLCINGTPWIWHLLEECVENAWEYWSVVIGLISIVCFLFAALPQIYVAYQNGRVDQALSLGFLLGWIAGDLTNFIGCYLTDQLPIQIVTAIFYVNVDIIMISQFVYCKLKNQEMKKCSKSLKNFCITWIMVCIALCVVLLCQLLLRNQDRSGIIKRSNNSLGMIEMSGFICGYISCVFYLGSRFPQLYKNFRRRSTEGTSYLLFALAMMGNCTYGLSLVLRMPATKSFQALYFLHHLPWLIGSFGVLFLDIFGWCGLFLETNGLLVIAGTATPALFSAGLHWSCFALGLTGGDSAIHPVSSAEGKAIWFSNTGSGTIAGERGDGLVLGCVLLLGFSLYFALGLF